METPIKFFFLTRLHFTNKQPCIWEKMSFYIIIQHPSKSPFISNATATDATCLTKVHCALRQKILHYLAVNVQLFFIIRLPLEFLPTSGLTEQ